MGGNRSEQRAPAGRDRRADESEPAGHAYRGHLGGRPYRFPAVPPGPYKVTAELAGFGKVEKRATVSLDSTATVNLSLQLSTTAEITVTGEAPMVDVASTTQGTNYSAKVIEKLPVGRNYADIVFTQPGVQADFGETQGRSLAISIYGSTSSRTCS